MNMSEILPLIRKEYLISLANEGKREDGRALDEYRSLDIRANVVDKAEGSALVSLGGTMVFAGVKVDAGEPYPDTPDDGVMITGAELIPMAAPDFEAGPPGEEAVEVARVVDRGIRESKALDTKALCVRENELVRLVFVDLHVMDYDGNLIDACGVAAMTALATSQMPVLDENDKPTEEKLPLPVRDLAVPCTFVKLGNSLLVDPSLDEERALDSRITVATDQEHHVCAMQKSNIGGFSLDEIKHAVRIATVKGEEIRAAIREAIK
ncbi:MAG: exosome complex protein Rrp42 [Theionarchaea archaeon]|nr:exosome complex protein Rrp42 [Theionarchaea archaeon]MBU7037645.1 exosome complex protein Rrp42 [Theionarchaea archaeon]